ncbi:MAG: hypothetical protein R3F11_28725 [Verrucomicrobiales bacterium]
MRAYAARRADLARGLTDRRRRGLEQPVAQPPDLVDALPSFEAPSGWADSYGTRLSGFIIPLRRTATIHFDRDRRRRAVG